MAATPISTIVLTDGLSCDWLVNNDGDTYTIDNEVFQKTYRQVNPGSYVKTTPIWAHQAKTAGTVQTKEGETHYNAGDFIVSNNEDGSDGYAISCEKFNSMYEPDE